jgi:cytochrome P450
VIGAGGAAARACGVIDLDLTDPRLYAREDLRVLWTALRESDPVHWSEGRDGSGFWSLTRHRDVSMAYLDFRRFSSEGGVRLDSDAVAVSAARGKTLLVSDPPKHTALKRVFARSFAPTAVAGMRQLVDEVVASVVSEAIDAGECDFVAAVAARVPSEVVCSVMGVPTDDRAVVSALTAEALTSPHPAERIVAQTELLMYCEELMHERRSRPSDDVVDAILASGSALTDEEIVLNLHGIFLAANETTRFAAAGGLVALIEAPDAWEFVSERPSAIAHAVEEVLRWTSPGMHVVRTAIEDITIGGCLIRAGERVTLWIAAANDDPEVFHEPGRFVADRLPNPHLTFGLGRHVCIGAPLARLELQLLLAELVRRVERVELAGELVRIHSNHLQGYQCVPVRLTPK